MMSGAAPGITLNIPCRVLVTGDPPGLEASGSTRSARVVEYFSVCSDPKLESFSNQSGEFHRSGVQSTREWETLHRIAKGDLVCRVIEGQRAAGTIVPE